MKNNININKICEVLKYMSYGERLKIDNNTFAMDKNKEIGILKELRSTYTNEIVEKVIYTDEIKLNDFIGKCNNISDDYLFIIRQYNKIYFK